MPKKCPHCQSTRIVGSDKKFKCLKCNFEHNEYISVKISKKPQPFFLIDKCTPKGLISQKI